MDVCGVKIRFKRIGFVCILLAISMTMISCFGYHEYRGIRKGFGNESHGGAIAVAVGSNQTSFAISEVRLDYYYGWLYSDGYTSNPFWDRIVDDDYEPFGVGVQFKNTNSYYDPLPNEVEDYKDLGGEATYYFVKLIDPYEYITDDYKVTTNFIKGRRFSHKETLTAPSELFEKTEGYMEFDVFAILFSSSKNMYKLSQSGKVWLSYQILQNGRVDLSEH